jgi:hypothetical protein
MRVRILLIYISSLLREILVNERAVVSIFTVNARSRDHDRGNYAIVATLVSKYWINR